jgi:hypothetical protein
MAAIAKSQQVSGISSVWYLVSFGALFRIFSVIVRETFFVFVTYMRVLHIGPKIVFLVNSDGDQCNLYIVISWKGLMTTYRRRKCLQVLC